MRKRLDRLSRTGLGAVSGTAGTGLIHAVIAGSRRWLPAAVPPLRQDPGEFMVERAEANLPPPIRERLSGRMKKATALALVFGYGATCGALYGLLRSPERKALRDGMVLGLATWAVGYLGWLPRSGLMPPVSRQRPLQVIGPVLGHALYGVATTAMYREGARALECQRICRTRH